MRIAAALLACACIPAAAQTDWLKCPDNPVLHRGSPGSWNETGVFGASVIFHDGQYRMWFSGWSYPSLEFGIGYALSPDGVTWTQHAGNPVLSEDPDTTTIWDTYVSDPCVIRDELEPDPACRFKMWYGANDGQYPFDLTRIGYATSPDGITWTRYPDHVLDVGPQGAWDACQMETPLVIRRDSVFHMWYCAIGTDNGDDIPEEGEMYQIGYAYSPDGISWTKYDDPSTTDSLYAESDPVLSPGDWTVNEWDGLAAAEPSVIVRNGTFELWYVGVCFRDWPPGPDTGGLLQVGYATSPDAVHWTKYSMNPVLGPGPVGQWDSVGVHTPFVADLADSLRMWYCTYSSPGELGIPDNDIGLASSCAEGIGPSASNAAGNLRIFPNPFTSAVNVSLAGGWSGTPVEIFDCTGRLVRRLEADDGPGTLWNGLDMEGCPVPPGVYVLRVCSQAGAVAARVTLLGP